MTVRTIAAGGQRWRFAPDDPPLAAERSQAMLQARLVDEVLNAPPPVPLQLATNVHGAIGRAGGGGRVGVVGRPAQAFHTPAVALARMNLAVRAPGFLPLELVLAVGPQPGYPAAFAPVDLGTVALHRTATRIAGRVVSLASGPIAGAVVTISAVWPVLAGTTGPSAPPDAMPLFAGLYADRAAGNVRRRNMSPAAQVKTLVRPAVAGDTVVRISDRQAIAAAQVLAIDFGDVGRAEFVGIAAIDTGSSADQPADVTLDLPLRRDHAEAAPAARAVTTGGGVGPGNAITRAARVGDETVWTAALTGIGVGTTGIQVDGGGAPAEYHASQIYRAVTNGMGNYALPPIHRIAAVELTVAPPGPPPTVRTVVLAWGATEQTEDFLFP